MRYIKQKGIALIDLMIVVTILYLIVVFVVPFFMRLNVNNETEVYRQLSIDGYENVNITKQSRWGCSEDDLYGYHFEAMKNKNVITGVVCGGGVKAWTIRRF